MSPLDIVSLLVPSDISQAYIPLIADQVLSPLRYLVASGAPVAERSTVPTFTSPIALVFVVLKDTNVPLAFVNVSTPLLLPTSTQPGLPLPASATYCLSVSAAVLNIILPITNSVEGSVATFSILIDCA